MTLEKMHSSSRKLQKNRLDYKQALHETDELFQQCVDKVPVPQPTNSPTPLSISEKVNEGLFRLFAKPYTLLEPTQDLCRC